ncbi:RTA1 like protein-domain-containing protein [Echria macrotheca]|uniref:RTA1 like protein-domain-containing protein n=1 Tax=Echria macrotheca TaxID=438768 RepID=A0AAJ0B3C3_9PEZI|nr:RTA1 like protein-domain-containing protein [Echria macrotheca]
MDGPQSTDLVSPYNPSPAGNAFMLAAFAALVPVSLYTGFRYRTLLYTSIMVTGLLVEVVGHAAAAFLQFDPANRSLFCLFMIGTLWGATLIGSVNYLVLPRVMVIYGKNFSLVSHPAYFSISFLVLDIFALVFQSAGVTLASHSHTADEAAQGTRMLIGGLSIQVTSLVLFLAVYWFFRLKLSRRRYDLDLKFSSIFSSSRFSAWLLCMQISAVLLSIRAVIRVAAFSGGLSSDVAGSRLVTFTLDDSIVLLACTILVLAPAGRAFGNSWEKTSPFSSPEGSLDLPLRHQQRSRRRLKNMSISKPFTSATAFQPLNGGPPHLRHGTGPPPLTSPREAPVYVRPAYDLSPPPVVPLQNSQSLNQMYKEAGERRSGSWPLAPAPDSSRLVRPDTIWG